MATIADLNILISCGIDDFEFKMKKVQDGIGRLGDYAKSAGQSLSTYVTLPLALLAGASIAALAKIDGLTRGLNAISTIDLGKQGVTGLAAVTQAAAATSERLKLLQEIARAPGIGFEQAVQGDIRLRAVGISASQSAAVLKEFANAIALTGGGAGKLDEVTVQLAQLSAKGKVLAQDLRPIIEAAPAVATALQKLYGTVDSETISKSLQKQGKSSKDFITVLTDELGKIPRVTGGIGNSIDNFTQGATQSLAKLGDALNRALNVDENVNRLSDFLTGLADSFAALDPGVQKAVFLLAGLAAAAGPVLLAIGAIGAAVPAVVAGLALLTGPIALAIAAVLALTAAGVAYAASGTSATEAFRSQRESVKALTDSVNPLLSRYEELKGKSSLTKAEQEELRATIEAVGKQIPTAITGFDAYGRALDINSAKAADFVKAQQEILAVKNRDALTEQRAEYARLTGQIEGATAALNKFDAAGNVVKFVGSGDDLGGDTFALTAKEITDLQAKLAGLRESRRGVGGLIDELKGIAPAVAAANAAGPVKPPVDAAAEKAAKAMAKALAEVEKSLRTVDNESRALGDSYDYLKSRQSALEGGIKTLLSAGYSPYSAAVQNLVGKYKELNTVLGDNNLLQAKELEGLMALGKAGENDAFGAKIKRNPLDNSVLKDDTGPPKELAGLSGLPAKLKGQFEPIYGALAEFNTRAGDILSTGLGNLATTFFAGLGQLTTGGITVEQFGGGLLGVIGEVCTQLGQAVIAVGIGMLGLKTAFTNPFAAIAAGAALLVIGGALSSIASSAVNSGGGSAGSGVGGSLASSPRSSFTPTVAPTAGAAAPKTYTHNVIITANGRDLRGSLDLQLDAFGRVTGRR